MQQGLSLTSTSGGLLVDEAKTVLRKSLYPVLDRVKRFVGIGYAAYVLSPTGRVALVQGELAEVRSMLREWGFEYQLLAAIKYRLDKHHSPLDPYDLQPDDGSYTLRDPKNPEKQYHVHLFERPDGVEVTAHYEYVPYPDWSAANPLERPLKHYRGVGHDIETGVTFVRTLLKRYRHRYRSRFRR